VTRPVVARSRGSRDFTSCVPDYSRTSPWTYNMYDSVRGSSRRASRERTLPVACTVVASARRHPKVSSRSWTLPGNAPRAYVVVDIVSLVRSRRNIRRSVRRHLSALPSTKTPTTGTEVGGVVAPRERRRRRVEPDARQMASSRS